MNIMIAIVIAGILTAIAVPNIMGMVVKAKQVEAKNQLEHLYSLERLHFLEYSRYSAELSEINFEQELLVTDGGGARYKIEIIEASSSSFMGQATSVEDFDGDGVFNVWQIDHNRKVTETIED